jgi:hypothetical protein
VTTMSLLHADRTSTNPAPSHPHAQLRPSSHSLRLSTVDCQLSCSVLHKSEAHPVPFQSLAHSIQKHPGVTSDRSSIFRSPLVYPEPRRVTRHPPLPKSFIRNTYKKHGGGGLLANTKLRDLRVLHSCAQERSPSHFLSIISVYPEPRRALFVCLPGMAPRAFFQLLSAVSCRLSARNSLIRNTYKKHGEGAC